MDDENQTWFAPRAATALKGRVISLALLKVPSICSLETSLSPLAGHPMSRLFCKSVIPISIGDIVLKFSSYVVFLTAHLKRLPWLDFYTRTTALLSYPWDAVPVCPPQSCTEVHLLFTGISLHIC